MRGLFTPVGAGEPLAERDRAQLRDHADAPIRVTLFRPSFADVLPQAGSPSPGRANSASDGETLTPMMPCSFHVVDDGAGDREQSARGELAAGLMAGRSRITSGPFLAPVNRYKGPSPTQQHFTLQQVVGRGKLRVVGRVLDVDRADEVVIDPDLRRWGRRLGQFVEFGGLLSVRGFHRRWPSGWSELGWPATGLAGRRPADLAERRRRRPPVRRSRSAIELERSS